MEDTLDVLPGEGTVQIMRQTRYRIECEECGEPAHFKHGYLLEGDARRNPASSAYGRDDCSWCSDQDHFTCKTCKKPRVDGYSWCSTFPASKRFAHMFLTWQEEEIKPMQCIGVIDGNGWIYPDPAEDMAGTQVFIEQEVKAHS